MIEIHFRHIEKNEKLLKKRQKKEYLYQVFSIDSLYTSFDKNDEFLDEAFQEKISSDLMAEEVYQSQINRNGFDLRDQRHYGNNGGNTKVTFTINDSLSANNWRMGAAPQQSFRGASHSFGDPSEGEFRFSGQKRVNLGSSIQIERPGELPIEEDFEKVFFDEFELITKSNEGYSNQREIEEEMVNDFVMSEDGLLYEREMLSFV